MVARSNRFSRFSFSVSAICGSLVIGSAVRAQSVAGEGGCAGDPLGLACCEASTLTCGIQSSADCGWARPPDPTDASELRLRALGVRLDGDLRDALGLGGRCLRPPACSPESGSPCSRSLFRGRRAVARVDRVQQFNDDADPGLFGVLDSPLLAGTGGRYGVKSGFQVGCPLLWFAPDSNPADGVDDSFLYLGWDVADLQAVGDPENLVTPMPFDGDGNGSACFGIDPTPGDNREERYEAHLRACADLGQFDPRNRATDGLLNQFEARLTTLINGLAKDPAQTWLHAEISTPSRALAFRDFGRLHQRILSFPTADGLLHQVDGSPTNPSDRCIQTELNKCRREVERTCRLTGAPCNGNDDCREVSFCDGKGECGTVRSCFFNNNNVELVVKRVETSGLFGPNHGRCKKTGRDCRTDARNARLCPRIGGHDPLCCDVNDAADECEEIAADSGAARQNRLAIAQLGGLFRADTDEDAAAEEEALVASFTSLPGLEVKKAVRCGGQHVCEGTTTPCKTTEVCSVGQACVEAPFGHETPHVAPGAVLEFEITVSNTGNEDLDVTLQDVLESVDLDPQAIGIQTASSCKIICENTCSVSGTPCNDTHVCPSGETCVPPLRAFLSSPRRALDAYEVTAKNAERPPLCGSDRSQCLRAAFFELTCTTGGTTTSFLEAARIGEAASLGTMLGARAVRSGDVCRVEEGDTLRLLMRIRTALAPGKTMGELCESSPPGADCRNTVSVDGRLVDTPVILPREALERCTDDWDCDDGAICNGVERCGANGQCQPSAPSFGFCPIVSICNGLEDPCRFPRPGETVVPPALPNTVGRPCTADALCNDGLLCNGIERCKNGACVAGIVACSASLACDELNTQGDRIDPCRKVIATDDASADVDLLCREIELIKEAGFPQCPCSFTTEAAPLSLSARCATCSSVVATAGATAGDDRLAEADGTDSNLANQASALSASSADGPFVPLILQYRLTATNTGDIPETVTLRDDELCRDLQSVAALEPGKLLVASDCSICAPPALNSTPFGPTLLTPGASVTTTCTLTFRTESAVNALLLQDTGICAEGIREGSPCATSEECPGGRCLFPTCGGETPIRSVDGEDCYRNCSEVTAAGDEPWLRPVPLFDRSAATVCLRPCELSVCKQVRCLEDCDAGRPGPWHSKRACSRHSEQCCTASSDCPNFDPANPSGPQSEQCVNQPTLTVAPNACLQYRITVTNPSFSEATLCALEFRDEVRVDRILDSTDFARLPYDVTVSGRQCEDAQFSSRFNVDGNAVICPLRAASPGGPAELRPGDSVSVQFRVDLASESAISSTAVPDNRILVRGQDSQDGCSDDASSWTWSCSGEDHVPVEIRVCDFEVRKDITCENPRAGLILRSDVSYEPDQWADVISGARAWFRIEIVNNGELPIKVLNIGETLTSSIPEGCNPSWFVSDSVLATIGNDDVTAHICTSPTRHCDEFDDLSGSKDFSLRPLTSGERLVITFAVEEPHDGTLFASIGTDPPVLDCQNSVLVSVVSVDLGNTCAHANPCLSSGRASAGFNIRVPGIECDKAVCLDRNNDGDCADGGDIPFAASVYLPPGLTFVDGGTPFPLTVHYRMTAQNPATRADGTAETAFSHVDICDSELARAIRVVGLVCAGGSRSGKLCRTDLDCPGAGSRCGDSLCLGGSRDGSACSGDSQCPQGICRQLTCDGGTRTGIACRVDADCPSGACRPPLEVVTCALVTDGIVSDCASAGSLRTPTQNAPNAAISAVCGLRFNSAGAWTVFSKGDSVGDACDTACFSNEAFVRGVTAIGTCVGGGNAGRPCSAPSECSGGSCRTELCGGTTTHSHNCTTEICVEPQCEILVRKEVRCLPDCDPRAVGENDGWVEAPEELAVVPGSCVDYRITIVNTSTSGIRFCSLEIRDKILPDGSAFADGPLDARMIGRQCRDIDFAQAFNWDGQALVCALVDPNAPNIARPLGTGESVVIRFHGRLKDQPGSGTPNLDFSLVNHVEVRGNGTCETDCAKDRSAGYSCEAASDAVTRLQSCVFSVVHDVGCPEIPFGTVLSDGAIAYHARGEGSGTTPDNCDDSVQTAGGISAIQVLPGSMEPFHLRLENSGIAPITHLSIDCEFLGDCDAAWFDGNVTGSICELNGVGCTEVTPCRCSGSGYETVSELCGARAISVCKKDLSSGEPLEIPPAYALDLVVMMQVPDTSPPPGDNVDCIGRFTLRAGTASCVSEEGCGLHCTESIIDVLAPRLDCEKEICADLDRDGVCEEFTSIVDLGQSPPAPFDLIYRFRLHNTGDVDLRNARVGDAEFRTHAETYRVANRPCDLALLDGSSSPIALAAGEVSPYYQCTLRFPTVADFEAFANADGRPNNLGEICHTNTAEPFAEIEPPPSVCPFDATVRTGSCTAEVCTRKCDREPCPPTTTVVIDVFNENESKFSGIQRCIDSWNAHFLSVYTEIGVPNYFWRETLGTDKGMARINAVASAACGKESVPAPLLGVASKLVLFTDDRTIKNIERTGSVPVGLGAQAGTIWYDTRSAGGERVDAASAPEQEPRALPIYDLGGTKPDQRDPGAASEAIAGAIPLGNETPVGGIGRLGSVLVFPKIEVKWNSRNQLIQDTFLDIANNSERDVYIQTYLVESERCGSTGNGFALTMRQPVFWSAARGDPRFVSPLTSLGDGCRDEDPRNPGGRALRGYLLLWAVDAATLREVRWNSLKGDALIINYAEGSAWEYEAWAFQALAGAQPGALLREPFGRLDLDGAEYEASPDELLLDFHAVGARFGDGNSPKRAETDTELILWAVLKDLRTGNRP